MNKGQLRQQLRADIKDDVKKYFFTDAHLDRLINEAEIEAARRALLLVDSTSRVTSIDLSAGDSGAYLDPSIIYVRRARLASTKRPLTPCVARAMDEMIPSWEEDQASVPIRFVPDWQTGYIRLWPATRLADRLSMTVVRKPLNAMVDDEDEPEIREHYHLMLLDWVKHRCYAVQDFDLYDPKKSEAHKTEFVRNFGESRPLDEHWAQEQYYDVGAN